MFESLERAGIVTFLGAGAAVAFRQTKSPIFGLFGGVGSGLSLPHPSTNAITTAR